MFRQLKAVKVSDQAFTPKNHLKTCPKNPSPSL